MADFEKASRANLTFKHPTKGGVMGINDLWNLSLDTLDAIAVGLFKESQENSVSFIKTKTEGNARVELSLDIVKRVIEVKMAEADARRDAVARAEKRQRIAEILETRKDEDLKKMSTEDLEKLLAQ